jgi:hypothetical protein
MNRITNEEMTLIQNRENELSKFPKKKLWELNMTFYPNSKSEYDSIISIEYWVHSILYNEFFIDKTDEFDSCYKNIKYREYLNRNKNNESSV